MVMPHSFLFPDLTCNLFSLIFFESIVTSLEKNGCKIISWHFKRLMRKAVDFSRVSIFVLSNKTLWSFLIEPKNESWVSTLVEDTSYKIKIRIFFRFRPTWRLLELVVGHKVSSQLWFILNIYLWWNT